MPDPADSSKLEETYRIARSGLLARGLWSLWLAREENDELLFGGFAIPAPRSGDAAEIFCEWD
jgi:hypothetical protein